ncbi:hypothetical protein [Paenibacillus cremeus]|uniref:DUF2642 domain-containing protein n=1 Tax=Paenibacillus cremeus TaxID=2163881 RepID=A0A559K970_9BACL|nr:hypothetical protein [Paenibacillus cremeus]TVY08671.1 hypothetical protein FPZ49_17775 [Paenibacillus cremeus]
MFNHHDGFNHAVFSTLNHVGLGTRITIFFDSTNRTGKFQGIQHGNAVLTTDSGSLFFIPVNRIVAVSIP